MTRRTNFHDPTATQAIRNLRQWDRLQEAKKKARGIWQESAGHTTTEPTVKKEPSYERQLYFTGSH